MMIRICLSVFLINFHIPLNPVTAEEIRVAVAANFHTTLHEIVKIFKQNTDHTILISRGSSGKFYAQIKHGAPFDVFFSADVLRPFLLEEEGLSVIGSRFTYAVGRLTLWSPDPIMLNNNGPQVLSNKGFKHLAMANPKTAPYGTAALQTLKALGLWNLLKDRIVQGENIGQTFHFVFSNNAPLGFVARSQVLNPTINGMGSRWDVPKNLHEPLRQQAVLLIHGQHNQAATAFLDYAKGPEARNIIKQSGYGLE